MMGVIEESKKHLNEVPEHSKYEAEGAKQNNVMDGFWKEISMAKNLAAELSLPRRSLITCRRMSRRKILFFNGISVGQGMGKGVWQDHGGC